MIRKRSRGFVEGRQGDASYHLGTAYMFSTILSLFSSFFFLLPSILILHCRLNHQPSAMSFAEFCFSAWDLECEEQERRYLRSEGSSKKYTTDYYTN